MDHVTCDSFGKTKPRKINVDMLNAAKTVLADLSSVNPSSSSLLFALNVSQHTLYGIQHIHANLTFILNISSKSTRLGGGGGGVWGGWSHTS